MDDKNFFTNNIVYNIIPTATRVKFFNKNTDNYQSI